MRTSAIITAAGYGRRMKKGTKKQFLTLGQAPIIIQTLKKFQTCNLIDEIILVVANDEIARCKKEVLSLYNLTKVVRIVAGGETRQDSVFNGLKNVSKEIDIVSVHDGVRPFVNSRLIELSVKKAREKGAAIPAVPVKDTLKKISNEMTICGEVSRSSLWRIQTPQSFKKEILIQAFEKAKKDNFYGTDESTLVTRLGIPVYLFEGSELNIKITTPEDILLGESILATLASQK